MIGYAQTGDVTEHGKERVVPDSFKRVGSLWNLLFAELIDELVEMTPQIRDSSHGCSVADVSRTGNENRGPPIHWSLREPQYCYSLVS
jgi:hypothetical protein